MKVVATTSSERDECIDPQDCRTYRLEKARANGRLWTLKNNLKIALTFFFSAQILATFALAGSVAGFKTAALDGAIGSLISSNGALHVTSSATNGVFLVAQPFSWNGEISARIRRSTPSTKLGMVFRENTNAISRGVGMYLTESNTAFERVLDLKQPSVSTVRTNEQFEWLRVVREGNAFSGFHSSDGTNWIQFSADSIDMPNDVFAGFAISGVGESRIDNIRMTSAHLASPLQNSRFVVPTNIVLKAVVESFGEEPHLAEFFSGITKIGETTQAGSLVWTNALAGTHSLTAKISARSGSEFFTEPVNCEIKLPRTAATLLRIDATTKGDWKGNYGADGFAIANHSTNLPPYVQWIPAGFRNHIWTHSGHEKQGLMRVDSEKRIASSWFHPKQLNIDLTLADGNPHQFAIYFLDWDRNNRSTLIEVLDASNNKLLDSRTLSSFSEGKYLVWSLIGHVKIRITGVKGNPSISGLFFDSEMTRETQDPQ